jgi:hypothetical protein
MLGVVFAVDLEDEKDYCDDYAADGEVDIKTPSPCDMISEDTSKEGSSNGCNSPHSSNETKGGWAFGKGYYLKSAL